MLSDEFDIDARIPSFLGDDDDDGSSTGEPPDVDITNIYGEEDSTNDDEGKVAYLLRYEELVRAQDAEEVAIVGHLYPLFERVLYLGGGNDGDDDEVGMDSLSFGAMNRALRILDDPETNDATSEDILRSDQHLLMVLRELVGSTSSGYEGGQVKALSFPEFLQCYRIAVGGTQALEKLEKEIANEEKEEEEKKNARIRTLRELANGRVTRMIQTFGRDGPFGGTNGTSGGEGRDEHDFAADEMKKTLTVKDRQFVQQLIESHARDVDKLEDQVRVLRASRKRQTVLLIIVAATICLVGVVFFARRQPRQRIEYYFDVGGEEGNALDAINIKDLNEEQRVAWSEQRASEVKRAGAATDQIVRVLEKKRWAPKTDLGQLRQFSSGAMQTVWGMHKIIAALARQIENIRKEKASVVTALDNSKEGISALESRVAQLKDDNKSFKTAAEASGSALKQCQAGFRDMEVELDKARRNLSVLESCPSKLTELQLSVVKEPQVVSPAPRGRSSIVEFIHAQRKMFIVGAVSVVALTFAPALLPLLDRIGATVLQSFKSIRVVPDAPPAAPRGKKWIVDIVKAPKNMFVVATYGAAAFAISPFLLSVLGGTGAAILWLLKLAK